MIDNRHNLLIPSLLKYIPEDEQTYDICFEFCIALDSNSDSNSDSNLNFQITSEYLHIYNNNIKYDAMLVS